MKVIKSYKCEICGTIYWVENDARKCEEAHKILDNHSMKVGYHQGIGTRGMLFINQTGTPDYIVIRDKDGTPWKYDWAGECKDQNDRYEYEYNMSD